MRQMFVAKLLSLLLLGFGSILPAHAATLSYGSIPINAKSAENLSGQCGLHATGAQRGPVPIFSNNAGVPSSITDIYFDEAENAPFSFIKYHAAPGAAVDFHRQVALADLSGASVIGFFADYSSASSVRKSGAVGKGVNSADEWIVFLGSWANAVNFDGLLVALASNDFRNGLYIQAAGGQEVSAPYVNQLNPVPLPAAAWLFASALFGFVVVANRRKV